MVAVNQSVFIKSRSIHDNFRSVQLACRWLNAKQFPSVLIKVDIAKAFRLAFPLGSFVTHWILQEIDELDIDATAYGSSLMANPTDGLHMPEG